MFVAAPFLLALLGSTAAEVASRSSSPPSDPELNLTLEEKLAFDKFKAAVYPNITDALGWRDYLAQDLYLLRWIRANDLNVEIAKTEMLQFLTLIRKGEVDAVMSDEFPDIAPDFPIHKTKDREGRNIFLMSMAEGWNYRRTILQGKLPRLLLFTHKIVFQIVKTAMAPGANNTQAWILMDMDGFNVFQHSCPACISYYLRMLGIFEQYAPGCIREIIVINAPGPFLALLDMVKPVLSHHTRKNLRVFGSNKSKWMFYLDKVIGLENLPWEFGGSGQ